MRMSGNFEMRLSGNLHANTHISEDTSPVDFGPLY